MIWYDALKEIKAIIDSDLDAIARPIDMNDAIVGAPAPAGGEAGAVAERNG